jgi:hypothetical protein
MNRLPTPGQDNGTWGNVLNEFLLVEHNDDGTLKKAGAISVAQSTADAKYTKPASGIPETDLSSAVQGKLNASTQIPDGSITDAKIASNAGISQSKITGLAASLAAKKDASSHDSLNELTDVNTTGAADGQALVYSGGSWAPGTVGADSTGNIPADASVTAVKIATGAVTNAKVSDSAAIDQSKINGLVSELASKAPLSHSHGAAEITSGVISPARLGSGAANTSTYLRGDGTWSAVSGGGSVAAADITDASTVGRNVLKASDAATARGVIGAGTSNLSLGTSSTNALAGDFAATAAATYATKASPTFTGSVVVPTPTQATHATNKSYVDGRGDLAPVTSGISWSGSVDASTLAFPGTHRRSLVGNTVVTGFPLPPSSVSGTMTIKVIQSASGSGQYTIQWPDGIYWAKGKSAPQAPTVAGDWIIVHFFWDGIYWSGVMQGEYAD